MTIETGPRITTIAVIAMICLFLAFVRAMYTIETVATNLAPLLEAYFASSTLY